MAEVVDSMPNRHVSGMAKYPWDDWLDGQAWRLVRGVDFDCPVMSMDAVIRQAARRRGLKMSIVPRDGVLFLQARPA